MSVPKVFLSIDLDYWRYERHQSTPAPCVRFFRRVMDLGLPVFCSLDHTLHLDWTARFDFDALVNVDAHSDLGGSNHYEYLPPLNCGTWVDYVTDGKQGQLDYVWHYPPGEAHGGRCDCAEGLPYSQIKHYYRSIARHSGLPRIDGMNIVAVAVAYSPDYWWWRTVAPIAEELAGTQRNVQRLLRIFRGDSSSLSHCDSWRDGIEDLMADAPHPWLYHNGRIRRLPVPGFMEE